MSSAVMSREPLYSALASDPDLSELVDAFVAEMPARCDLMRNFFAAADWAELKRAAHQLKGAAGGYGFDQLTPCAARLESVTAACADPGEIREALEELVARCGLIRAGTQESG